MAELPIFGRSIAGRKNQNTTLPVGNTVFEYAGSTSGGLRMTQNMVYFHLVSKCVVNTFASDTFNITIHRSSGAVGNQMNVAIYSLSQVDGKPDKLLWENGSVAFTTSADVSFSATVTNLPDYFYLALLSIGGSNGPFLWTWTITAGGSNFRTYKTGRAATVSSSGTQISMTISGQTSGVMPVPPSGISIGSIGEGNPFVTLEY